MTVTKLVLMLVFLMSVTLQPKDQPKEAKVTPLFSKDLTELPGKEGLMITVEYPPGSTDPIHRHNAHGFIYVLEGSIVMQVRGGKEVTLTPGQTFYEGPDDVHVVGRNSSQTKPAKFVVFFVKDKGAAIVVPEKYVKTANMLCHKTKRRNDMSTITVKDGTTIFYKDWGSGPVVTFSHGWPLCSDAWDGQMLFLAQNGFRVVAHDRRGHGRSSQAWSGNDMNGYADDLAALIEALDLTAVTMVGHSTGGGEVARYIGRHGTKRVAAAVLIGAVPPVMVKSAANPDGIPIEVFDGLRSGVTKDRSQFWKDFAIMFYGANRPGAKVSQGMLDQFWLWSMQGGLKNVYDSIKAFSETDFHEDLKKFDVPTLVMHGGDDQIVPIDISGRRSAKLIKGAKELFYPGLPHGLTATNADQVNADLLKFLKSVQQARRASA